MLNLAPRWFRFATEAEKNEHGALTTLMDKLEGEINTLLSRAMTLSERVGDKKIRASVLMSMGSIESARYLRYKMDCIAWSSRNALDDLCICSQSNV